MLRDILIYLQKDMNLDDDIQFDWVIHKQRLIDQRTAAEEAEKRAKIQTNSRVKSRLAKGMMSKLAAIEEAERKQREEAEQKKQMEEQRRKQKLRELEESSGIYKTKAQIQADIENQKKEMRIKIGKKILEIVKKEEAAAKKMIDDEEMDRINQLNQDEMPEFEDPLKDFQGEEEKQEDLQDQFKKKESKSKMLMVLEKAVKSKLETTEGEEGTPADAKKVEPSIHDQASQENN